jgi:DNA repair ATPase RecN
MIDHSFSDHHSELDSLKKQLEKLNEQLTESSTRLSKFRRSSLWQRYWTAVTVGAISALLTNLLLMMG